MTAYRHDEYGTGTTHSLRFYALTAALSALAGTALALVTFA